MTVKAWLEGRPGDLAALMRHFTGDPAVRRDEGEDYYLTSSAFDPLWTDVSGLQAEATASLTHLNGAARVLDPEYRPVRLRGRYSDSTGRGNIVTLEAAVEVSTAFGLATISINGVPQVPPPSPGPDLAQLANRHPDVAEVFGLMSQAKPFDWDPLFKVYEIVRQNVGGTNNGAATEALLARNWATQFEIDTFLASACDPKISGSSARHARHTSRPRPHGALTESEGRAFISRLVRCWLDSL